MDRDGEGTYTAEGINAIADAVRVSTSLTQVLAFYNFFHRTLCFIMKLPCLCFYSLSQLNLDRNILGPAGASALAESLKVNTSLTQVLAFLPATTPLPPLL